MVRLRAGRLLTYDDRSDTLEPFDPGDAEETLWTTRTSDERPSDRSSPVYAGRGWHRRVACL